MQVPCTRYGDRRPLARARFRWRPAAMGGACGARPRLAAAGCAKACRPRRWRFALVRHEGRLTDTPPGFAMEHPRHASTTSSQSAARSVLARRWGIGLASVRAQAGEAVTRGCRVGHVSIRERTARASLACRESWRGSGCALGFRPQPSSENNFPCAARIPRGTNSFRFQALHGVATAARCGQPIPRRPDHNKDALARPCSTRKEKHHG